LLPFDNLIVGDWSHTRPNAASGHRRSKARPEAPSTRTAAGGRAIAASQLRTPGTVHQARDRLPNRHRARSARHGPEGHNVPDHEEAARRRQVLHLATASFNEVDRRAKPTSGVAFRNMTSLYPYERNRAWGSPDPVRVASAMKPADYPPFARCSPGWGGDRPFWSGTVGGSVAGASPRSSNYFSTTGATEAPTAGPLGLGGCSRVPGLRTLGTPADLGSWSRRRARRSGCRRRSRPG